jgi:uncharacterized damage-inducible protein DinB
MKKLAALALLALCSLPAFSQENKMTQMLAKHWKTSRDLTLAVAEAMPESGYTFKPNAGEMSYGELMVHIALAQANYASRAAGEKSPLQKPEATDKATAIKLLNDSYSYCIGKIEALNDDKLSAAAEPLWGGFTHTAHHRGQAEVYLRVKDITPPTYKF